jgi:hypothetical protein
VNGAKKYYDAFKGRSQQINRLYLSFSTHARGKCFSLYVLPEGAEKSRTFKSSNMVEVYGIINGQPGWTESYGWLHEGKWQDDFNRIVEEVEAKNEEKEAARLVEVKKEEDKIEKINEIILSSYT